MGLLNVFFEKSKKVNKKSILACKTDKYLFWNEIPICYAENQKSDVTSLMSVFGTFKCVFWEAQKSE